jgi:hypothetical protein
MLEGGEQVHGLSAEELHNLGGHKKKFDLPRLDDPEHGYDIKGAEDTEVEDEEIKANHPNFSKGEEATRILDLKTLGPKEGKRRRFADSEDSTRIIDLNRNDQTSQIKITGRKIKN